MITIRKRPVVFGLSLLLALILLISPVTATVYQTTVTHPKGGILSLAVDTTEHILTFTFDTPEWILVDIVIDVFPAQWVWTDWHVWDNAGLIDENVHAEQVRSDTVTFSYSGSSGWVHVWIMWTYLVYPFMGWYYMQLQADLYLGGGGGGSGCPTLFVWDGDEYAEEGILNIHADSDITVQHEVQNTLALENGVYKLQLRELDEYTSHIDQVQLYAVDYEGEWCLCPLTYAYHNLLGKVKHTLRFDDDNRVDLKPTEIINLKFGQPIPYSETEYFIFEINGYNPKPPIEAW